MKTGRKINDYCRCTIAIALTKKHIIIPTVLSLGASSVSGYLSGFEIKVAFALLSLFRWRF
jgi:hypothetical protein